MGTIDIAKLRNVGFVGQGDSGKTSLAEAVIFAAGKTDRLGKVDEGNSNFDYEEEEIRRKITIVTKLPIVSMKISLTSWRKRFHALLLPALNEMSVKLLEK